MWRCDQVLEMAALLAVGDDAVDPADRVRLDAHLSACAACAREAAVVRRAIETLQQDEVPDPGAVYWAAFTKRLRARIASSRPGHPWRRPLAALAAAAVVLIGVGLTLHAWLGPAGGQRPRQAALPSPDRGGPQAEARLEALLNEGPDPEANRRQLETILDEMVPIDPLGFDDALDALSPRQTESLIEELRGDES